MSVHVTHVLVRVYVWHECGQAEKRAKTINFELEMKREDILDVGRRERIENADQRVRD